MYTSPISPNFPNFSRSSSLIATTSLGFVERPSILTLVK